MFQQLFSSESACRRHGDAPFADERERYLQHCAEQGSTRATLRVKANELLWLAQHLESNASDGVNIEALQDIVRERQSVCQGATTARRLVDIARPWLVWAGGVLLSSSSDFRMNSIGTSLGCATSED